MARSNDQGPPAAPAVVPSQERPGIEAAALMSTPIPGEQPAAHASPVPQGGQFLGGAVVTAAGAAQQEQALYDGEDRIGQLASNEQPATFYAAVSECAALTTQRDDALRLTTRLHALCAGRLDRTKAVVVKVIGIYLMFALGEVALNASAAVALGEVPAMAAMSFLGLAAASIGVGWLVGTKVRDAVDRQMAGALPEGEEGRGLEPLFRSADGGRFSAVPADLWVWLTALVFLAVASGVLVADLRVAAGTSPAWGLVSSALVFVAAAPPYLLRNRVADMMEAAMSRIEAMERRIRAAAVIMDAHTAAQQLTQAARRSLPHAAAAAYLTSIAGGYGQIATKQSHLVGHWVEADSLPVKAEQFVVSHPVGATGQVADVTWMTDHDRLRGQGTARIRPAVAPQAGEVSQEGAWEALLTRMSDGGASVPAAANGHRP